MARGSKLTHDLFITYLQLKLLITDDDGNKYGIGTWCFFTFIVWYLDTNVKCDVF